MKLLRDQFSLQYIERFAAVILILFSLLLLCLKAQASSSEKAKLQEKKKEVQEKKEKVQKKKFPSRYERDLLNLDCAEAIRKMTEPLHHALEKEDNKLASRIMQMIALSFRLDENDRAAAQAAICASQLDPEDAMAKFQAAEYLFRDGRWQESEEILMQLSKSTDKNLVLRAEAFLDHQTGRILAAIEKLEEYIKTKPEDQRALSRLSYLYLINEDNAKAAEVQRKLSELSFSDYLKEFYLGRADESEGKLPEAEAHYRKAGTFLPQDPLWHAQIASALMKKQKIKEADPEFRACFNCKRLLSSAYTNWAVMQSFFGSSENAKTCLNHVAALRPNANDIAFVYGIICEKNGNCHDAMPAFRRAVELNPHNSSPYLHLLGMSEIKNDPAKRIELCKQWCQGCAYSANAAIELGIAYFESGNEKDAAKSFERAEALAKGRKLPAEGTSYRILLCKMHAYLASIYYKQKYEDLALKEAEEFNSLRPESAAGFGMRPKKFKLSELKAEKRKAATHALLADSLSETRMLGLAEIEYRKAIKEDPDENTYHSCLLKVLLDKKDFAAAAAEDAAVSQHIVTHIGDLFSSNKK